MWRAPAKHQDIITNICIYAFGRLFNPKQKDNLSLHTLPGI